MTVAWAVADAFLSYSEIGGTLHPAPYAALWFNNWTLLVMGALLLAIPAAVLPVVVMSTGWRFLRRSGLASRGWKLTWFGLTGAGVGAELLLIAATPDELHGLPASTSQYSLALLALILASATATITVMAVALAVTRPRWLPAGTRA
jgi:hypothetical protein